MEHRLREPASLAAQEAAPELASSPPPPPFAGADALWALGQIGTARHQIASAQRVLNLPLSRADARRRGRVRTRQSDQVPALAGSIAVLGTALLALLLWLAVGWWLAVAGVAGVLATAAAAAGWGWRLAVTWRGLRIDLRR